MMKRRAIIGSIWTFLGFVLSPLSWWNDALVNIPIAYFCAWVISLFHEQVFGITFILSYWLTNVLGFVMMHKGLCKISKDDCTRKHYWRKGFAKDLLLAFFYTGIILILLKMEIIVPVGVHFIHNQY